MARKLSELNPFSGTPTDTSEIEVLDKSDETYGAAGTNKRWSISSVKTWLSSLYAAASHTHTADDVSEVAGKYWAAEENATADQTDTEIETAYNNRVSVVSQGDAEAGSSSTVYRWTPLRVAQAIAALSAGGGLQNNFTATSDPTATDDTNAGYSVGSAWLNTDTDEAFRCADSTAGAAVWVKTSLTSDELATVALTGSYDDLTNKPTIPASTQDAISGASNFTTPGDTNTFGLIVSGVLRSLTFANLKAALKTYFDSIYAAINPTVVQIGNIGSTYNIDWQNGEVFKGTLDQDVTFSISNTVDGKAITLVLEYDGTAQRSATFSDVDEWANGAAPTMPTSTGRETIVTLLPVGGVLYGFHNTSAFSGDGGGTSDHGALSGLADDDHSQYAILDNTAASGAPAFTPSRKGALVLDTSNNEVYIALGNSSATDWWKFGALTQNSLPEVSYNFQDGTAYTFQDGTAYNFRDSGA